MHTAETPQVHWTEKLGEKKQYTISFQLLEKWRLGTNFDWYLLHVEG